MSTEAFQEDSPGPRGFSVDAEDHGETVVLNVVGEVDLVTAPVLEESITTVLARHPKMLVVDLTGVGFLASVGMSVLIGCNEQAGDSTRFRLVASGASTFRPMELTGVADVIEIYPTRERAMTEG
jgi:anti-sigma B factor antagonist